MKSKLRYNVRGSTDFIAVSINHGIVNGKCEQWKPETAAGFDLFGVQPNQKLSYSHHSQVSIGYIVFSHWHGPTAPPDPETLFKVSQAFGAACDKGQYNQCS